MSNSTDDDKPHLSISAHVVVQLGEELVTDKEQSILELVKNCYDADTTDCDIFIEPEWTVHPEENADIYFNLFPERVGKEKSNLSAEKVGKIVIKDDGDGMSDDAVRNSWLRISSSTKRPEKGKEKATTKSGRTPVGDKGLGRLATMKLGKIIRLTTTQQGEAEKRSLWFSWGDFTEDKELTEVPVHIEPATQKDNKGDKGSEITIIGLKELKEWEQDSFVSKDLVRDLSKLVSPFLEKKGFFINIHYSGHCYEISHLSDQALNLASCAYQWTWNDGKMQHSGRISENLFFGTGDGAASAEFNRVFRNSEVRKKFIERLLSNKRAKQFNLKVDKSPGLFTLDYADDIGDSIPQSKGYGNAKDPGPFSAQIYDFNLSRRSKEALSAAGVTSDLIKSTGIQIFRDGFLVRFDEDWLGLSQEQTGGSSYYGLRPGNTIGYFAISNKSNPRLVEKSDREAFVDNEEFRGFLYLARRAKDKEIALREILRREYRDFLKDLSSEKGESSSPADAIKATKESFSKQGVILNEAIQSLERLGSLDNKKAYESIGGVITSLQSVAKDQEKKNAQIEYIDRHVEGTEEVNLRLLEAAAVGLTARSISHELHQYSRQFKQGIDGIKAANKSIGNSIINKNILLLVSTLRELTKMVSALDPMLPGSRSVKEKIVLNKFVSDYLANRSEWATKKKVNIDFIDETSSGLVIRFSASRLLQILENLLQNSIYWLTAYKKAKFPEPLVTVVVTDTGIKWSDNGPGVNKLYEDSLFDPFISDKPNGEGQGLGLHISSVFLKAEKCSIWLEDERNQLGRRYQFNLDMSPAEYKAVQEGIL